MATVNIKNLIRESISDYLAELNTEREEIQETPTLKEGASEFEDKVTKDGNIYLVKKPSKDTAEGGIVEEVSLKSLIGEGYLGAYTTGTAALAAGKKALKARDTKLKENIQIGKDKVTELEAKIEELKRQIEDNSTRAVHDPQRRGELTETNNILFTQLEKIENAVEKLKTVLDKESPKKAKKEDKEEINEALKDSTKSHKGLKYEIWYEAPKGYYVKGLGEVKNEIAKRYFDKESQAQEHAEIEIDGYLREN